MSVYVQQRVGWRGCAPARPDAAPVRRLLIVLGVLAGVFGWCGPVLRVVRVLPATVLAGLVGAAVVWVAGSPASSDSGFGADSRPVSVDTATVNTGIGIAAPVVSVAAVTDSGMRTVGFGGAGSGGCQGPDCGGGPDLTGPSGSLPGSGVGSGRSGRGAVSSSAGGGVWDSGSGWNTAWPAGPARPESARAAGVGPGDAGDAAGSGGDLAGPLAGSPGGLGGLLGGLARLVTDLAAAAGAGPGAGAPAGGAGDLLGGVADQRSGDAAGGGLLAGVGDTQGGVAGGLLGGTAPGAGGLPDGIAGDLLGGMAGGLLGDGPGGLLGGVAAGVAALTGTVTDLTGTLTDGLAGGLDPTHSADPTDAAAGAAGDPTAGTGADSLTGPQDSGTGQPDTPDRAQGELASLHTPGGPQHDDYLTGGAPLRTDQRGDLQVQTGGWRPDPVTFSTEQRPDDPRTPWTSGRFDPTQAVSAAQLPDPAEGAFNDETLTATDDPGDTPPARLPTPTGLTTLTASPGGGPTSSGAGGGGGAVDGRRDTLATLIHRALQAVADHIAGNTPAADAHRQLMSWRDAAHGFTDPDPDSTNSGNSRAPGNTSDDTRSASGSTLDGTRSATSTGRGPETTNSTSSTNGDTGPGASGARMVDTPTGQGMALPTTGGGDLTITPLTTSPNSSVAPDLPNSRYLIDIDNAAAPGSYDFRLDMPDGAHTVQNSAGGVDIVSAGGQTVKTIDAPWAKDANGADLPTRFDIVHGPDGSTVLRQHVAFDENTAYPVVADPAAPTEAPASTDGGTKAEPAPSAPAEPQDESTTAHGGGNSGDQPGPEASGAPSDGSTTQPTTTDPEPTGNNDQSTNSANTDTDGQSASGSTDTSTGGPEPVTAPALTPAPGNPAPTAPPAPGNPVPAEPAPLGTGTTPTGPNPPLPSSGPEPVPTGPVTDLDPATPGVQTELPTGPTHADLTPATTGGPEPQGPTATEIGHTVLDVAGLIPGVGEAFDGINAAWYEAEGDHLNAALSGAAMVPGVGWLATGGKAFGKIRKALGFVPSHSPDVLRVGDLKLPAVPRGAVGTPVNTGKGLEYPIPPGTPELSPQVTSIRIMDPVTQGKYQYPDGYAVYMNKSGQTVDPVSGRTIPPTDPLAHIPLR